jgi:hypothetical protein
VRGRLKVDAQPPDEYSWPATTHLGGTVPKLEFTEKKISVIEGFAVKFRHAAPGNAKGRDVRSDKRNLPSYPYQRKAAGTQTVAAWIESRFSKRYPGYKVEVLDGDGRKVHGKTLLSTVRDTYSKSK